MMHKNLLGLAAAFALGVTAALATQETEAVEASYDTSASMPGPMHAHLEALVGSWKLHGKWRTAEGQAWQDFDALAEREWMYDGRFLRETVTSEWLGMPFEAVSFLGYDNVREEYVQVWLENASTGVQSATGQIDEAGVTMTMEGVNSNAMTREKNTWHRSVISLSDPDRTVYAGFAKDAGGREFQNMEMVADRR